jgi:DNA-binding HxlR family transcriptional regulator
MPKDNQSSESVVVLDALRTASGPLRFSALQAKINRTGTPLDMRVVDRALQRLRKEGAIKLITGPRGGWVVA